jgi:U3 small nucleolar RNA-associated protein 23
MRNKEHYILATAEPLPLDHGAQHDANESNNNPRKRKRAEEALQEEMNQKANALRTGARSVPGVPIIYVKRSVMILEPLSLSSERVRLGVEKSKFKMGVEAALSVVSGLKRKRGEGQDEEDHVVKDRGPKKAKAPNPLSMKKPKSREKQRLEDQGRKEHRGGAGSAHENAGDGETTSNVKTKRKRRHKSAKTGDADADAPAASVDFED